jgi:hypothetical protein
MIGPAIAIVALATAAGMWLVPAGRWVILAAGIVAGCTIVAAVLWNGTRHGSLTEANDIAELTPARWNELIRGTSLHLRDMRYRYSVRSDRTDSGSRKAFTSEINSIRLGFLPVILTDNETDYQGYGYLAFVFDGRRWRGPGLPCPDGREQAMAHAKRNVSPIAE